MQGERNENKMKKLGRNDLCWCGSGKKYKHCHEAFDEKLMEAADAGHQIPDHDMIKTPEQIEGIRESCKINVAVLDYVAEHIKAGVTTEEIDQWVYNSLYVIYLITIIGTILVSIIVSRMLSKKVNKIDMVSSLKANE